MSADLAPQRGSIVGGRHRLPVRVYFEDTDVTGLVYHANYVKYFERGRTDFLALLDVNHSALMSPSGENMIFAVSKFTIDYRRPAYLDDGLVVITELKRLGGARLVMHQWIEREGDLVADAEVHVATLDPTGRPRRIPEVLKERLATYQSADIGQK